MQKLKKLGSIVLLLFVLFGTVSCTSGDINKVTQDFFMAVNKGEYEQALAFVTVPGGDCLTCHNEVRNFKEVMSPGQLEEVNVENLMVKDEVATGYIEFTTTLGKVSKTEHEVTFTRNQQGAWKINYPQIARLTRWRVREPVFASSFEDIPKTVSPEKKTGIVYELALPSPGQILPMTESPLKPTEKDAKSYVFWSNSVKPEPAKVTFSPAVIAFKPDNEDPAVFESEGMFTVGGWLINNTERKVNGISYIRITITLDSRTLGQVIIGDEKVELPPGYMQYREYIFKSDSVDTNTNMNRVKCKYEFAVN